MQHLQQDNLKVEAAGDRTEKQEQQLQLEKSLKKEVQNLEGGVEFKFYNLMFERGEGRNDTAHYLKYF